jgi:hypothetical protein
MVAVNVGGGLLVLAGLVMLIAPGPGLLVTAAGLCVLGRRHSWARRMLVLGWQHAAAAGRRMRRGGSAADPRPLSESRLLRGCADELASRPTGDDAP